MKIYYLVLIICVSWQLPAAQKDSTKRKMASTAVVQNGIVAQKKQKVVPVSAEMIIDDNNKKKSEEIINELAKAIAAHRNNDVRRIVQEQSGKIDLSAVGTIEYINDITLPMWSVMKGNEIALNILLDAGINSNMQTMQGKTALMVAAEHGMDSMVRTLLAHGAQANLQDALGNTALNLLALEADINTDDINRKQKNIVMLLAEHGVNIDHQNKLGDTPLVTALRRSQPHLVQLLLKAGANPRQIHPKDQTTIYDMIAFKDSDNQLRRVHKARLAEAIKAGIDEHNQHKNTIIELLEPHTVPYVDVLMADYVGPQPEAFEEEEKRESAAWATYH